MEFYSKRHHSLENSKCIEGFPILAKPKGCSRSEITNLQHVHTRVSAPLVFALAVSFQSSRASTLPPFNPTALPPKLVTNTLCYKRKRHITQQYILATAIKDRVLMIYPITSQILIRRCHLHAFRNLFPSRLMLGVREAPWKSVMQ